MFYNFYWPCFSRDFNNLGNYFNYLNVILNILNTYSVKVIKIFVGGKLFLKKGEDASVGASSRPSS